MKQIFILFLLFAISEPHALNTDNYNSCDAAYLSHQQKISSLLLNKDDIDAITRVVIAEADNQQLSGKIAVIYIILNRYLDGNFGDTVIDVINRKWAFEPVTLAGSWDKLPNPTDKDKNDIASIIELIKHGYINDITHGSLYFQNPDIVNERIRIGTAKKASLHFNNAKPAKIIGDHYFYRKIKNKKKVKTAPYINNQPVLIFNKK